MGAIEKLKKLARESMDIDNELIKATSLLWEIANDYHGSSSKERLDPYFSGDVRNPYVRDIMIFGGLIDGRTYELTQEGREMYEELRKEGFYESRERAL